MFLIKQNFTNPKKNSPKKAKICNFLKNIIIIIIISINYERTNLLIFSFIICNFVDNQSVQKLQTFVIFVISLKIDQILPIKKLHFAKNYKLKFKL